MLLYDIVTRQHLEECNSAANSSGMNGILYTNFIFGYVQLELCIFIILEITVLNQKVQSVNN